MSALQRRGADRDQARRATGRRHPRRRHRARVPRRRGARPGRSGCGHRHRRRRRTASPAPRSSTPPRRSGRGPGWSARSRSPRHRSWCCLREDMTLFTYLHLAAYPAVADALLRRRHHRHRLRDGAAAPTASLPLLAPMSEIAGRMAVQVGAHFLERHKAAAACCWAARPGVRPARVSVLGAGNVGWNAAMIAAGMERRGRRCSTATSTGCAHSTRSSCRPHHHPHVQPRQCRAQRRRVRPGHRRRAGARRPGARSSSSEDMVRSDEARRGGRRHRHRPGRLHRDVPRDLAPRPRVRRCTGCMHYASATCPGAVPVTSTYALTNATLPYLVDAGHARAAVEACRADPVLALGLNTEGGAVVNAVVADSLGMAAGTPRHLAA